MRVLDYLLGGLALLALPVLFWWGIYQSPQSAVNLQARLDAQAKAALVAGGFEWAQVEMQGQRALLTGAAPSNDAIMDAAEAVLTSSGLGGVVFGGVTLVEARAEPAQAVSPYVWRAVKNGEGLFTLEGHVPTRAIRNSLVDEARLVGRSAVDDRMGMAVGAPAGNFQGVAKLAISQLARLDSGEVEITDHRITLRGTSSEVAARQQVRAAVSAMAAPFRGEALVSGGNEWRATLSGAELVLSGSVQSPAQREEILSLIQQAFPGTVRDEMEIDPALPQGWIEGVEAGLPDFLRFQAGEMWFDVAGGVFTFEGHANASTLYYLRENMTRSAGRWGAFYGVTLMSEGQADISEAVGDFAPQTVGPEAASSCGAEINRILSAGHISFAPESANLSRDSAAALDALAGAIRRCDRTSRFEIEAESAVTTAEIVDFLAMTGIARARLAAVSPAQRNDASSSSVNGAEGAVLNIRVVERSGE